MVNHLTNKAVQANLDFIELSSTGYDLTKQYDFKSISIVKD
jgi:hypothetical protein